MSSRGGSVCYKCNKPGHFARECTDSDDGTGGGRGRYSGGRGSYGGGNSFRGRGSYGGRGGFNGGSYDRPSGRCYRCNQLGHIARDCTYDINQSVCYNCNKSGHVRRDCTEPRSDNFSNGFRGGRGGSGTCYRCSQPGHFARDCPEPDPRSGSNQQDVDDED